MTDPFPDLPLPRKNPFLDLPLPMGDLSLAGFLSLEGRGLR
jgi:hypothetical protein